MKEVDSLNRNAGARIIRTPAPETHKNAIRENGVPRKPYTVEGWHNREYLPHFESHEVVQHVTFHLADSLPKEILHDLELQLKSTPPEKRDAERRKRVEAWADAGHGSCVLREPHVATMVEESFLRFDGERYRLLAWVVMPNHVHVLFQPMDDCTVAQIVASWKKFSARQICDYWRTQALTLRGPVWHREYWDRYIRHEGHFARVIDYIHSNPVKAGLVAKPEDWPWSSARRKG
jgi:putative transposase